MSRPPTITVRVRIMNGPHDGILFEANFDSTDTDARVLDNLVEAHLAERGPEGLVMVSLRGRLADGTAHVAGYGQGTVVLGERLLEGTMHAVELAGVQCIVLCMVACDAALNVMTRTHFVVTGGLTVNEFLIKEKVRAVLLHVGIDPARDGVCVDIGDDWQQLDGVKNVRISGRIKRMHKDSWCNAELWVRA